MSLIHALILGCLEGLTEFLPVSSTGHLILASQWLGIHTSEFTKSFEIIIQIGAIAAVGFLYARKIISLPGVLMKLGISFLPTVGIGLLMYPFVKSVLLTNGMFTAAMLVGGGLLMILLERTIFVGKRNEPVGLTHITYRQAFLIGVIQSLSIFPGVSRAAATIVGGMTVGLTRSDAVEYSFLLAVPTILAAASLDIVKTDPQVFTDWPTIIVGVIIAFATASVSVKWLIRFVKSNTFIPFGIYRIVIGFLYLASQWSGVPGEF